ncbi:MAG: hypothetical protein EON54_06185 [Alcaligenaceae bacterium]|nr:MAG: hypothetical protein EON54_06185 [Alcaligenaceae bacterium]
MALVDWCGTIPFIGDGTKFQLAKNFGGDFAKPDQWLSRLAGFSDAPRRNVRFRFPACMALCRPLAGASGERIAAVDSLLWLACNKGVLKVDQHAGPVTFGENVISARSIIEAAPSSREQVDGTSPDQVAGTISQPQQPTEGTI